MIKINLQTTELKIRTDISGALVKTKSDGVLGIITIHGTYYNVLIIEEKSGYNEYDLFYSDTVDAEELFDDFHLVKFSNEYKLTIGDI